MTEKLKKENNDLILGGNDLSSWHSQYLRDGCKNCVINEVTCSARKKI